MGAFLLVPAWLWLAASVSLYIYNGYPPRPPEARESAEWVELARRARPETLGGPSGRRLQEVETLGRPYDQHTLKAVERLLTWRAEGGELSCNPPKAWDAPGGCNITGDSVRLVGWVEAALSTRDRQAEVAKAAAWLAHRLRRDGSNLTDFIVASAISHRLRTTLPAERAREVASLARPSAADNARLVAVALQNLVALLDHDAPWGYSNEAARFAIEVFQRVRALEGQALVDAFSKAMSEGMESLYLPLRVATLVPADVLIQQETERAAWAEFGGQ